MKHLRILLAFGLVVTGALLAAASGVAQAAGPQNWLYPGGPVAEMQLGLFMLTTWIMVFVFVVVSGLLIYAIVKFRAKGAEEAGTAAAEAAAAKEDLPPQFEGDPRLEIVLTIVPFILLVIMAIPTVNLNFALAADPEGDPLH
ncbi:MAG: cytochrome c oxidase subunit II transmembrane domain-containing protein [Limnochordales bacterium]